MISGEHNVTQTLARLLKCTSVCLKGSCSNFEHECVTTVLKVSYLHIDRLERCLEDRQRQSRTVQRPSLLPNIARRFSQPGGGAVVNLLPGSGGIRATDGGEEEEERRKTKMVWEGMVGDLAYITDIMDR